MDNFGIYYKNENQINSKDILYTNICSCGSTFISDGNSKSICEHCNNKDFKYISSQYKGGKITSGSRLNVIEKGDWGFIIQKVNTNGKYNKTQNSLTLTGESKYILRFDYRNNDFSIENSRSEKYQINEYNIRHFFKDLDDNQFIDITSTEKTKNLYNLARLKFGKGVHWSTPNRLYKGLAKIVGKPYYQILANAGFNYDFLKSFSDVSERESWYYCSEYDTIFNLKETQPHKILNIPKYIIPYIKNINIKKDIIENLKVLDKKYGGTNTKIILDKLLDECDISECNKFLSSGVTLFIDVIENYSYDFKRLSEYICRDAKLNQGIISPVEALQLLKDYMRMMTYMKLHPDKYSKSLKKDHDIASMNYKVGKDQIMKENFKEVTEKNTYKNLLYTDKNYIIMIPNEPNDLIAEGKNLSHCVASYVEDVVKEKCQIIFIRTKENPTTSLLTVEIRNNKIVQVKGFGNRLAKQEEKDFLNKWSDAKGLLLSA